MLASRIYRMTWNLLSKPIVTITSKFPGSPITLKNARNTAMARGSAMLLSNGFSKKSYFSTSAASEVWQLFGYNICLHVFVTVVCFFPGFNRHLENYLGRISNRSHPTYSSVGGTLNWYSQKSWWVRLPFMLEIYWLCFHSCLSCVYNYYDHLCLYNVITLYSRVFSPVWWGGQCFMRWELRRYM